MLDESWSDATRRTPDDGWGVEYEDEPLTYPAYTDEYLEEPPMPLRRWRRTGASRNAPCPPHFYVCRTVRDITRHGLENLFHSCIVLQHIEFSYLLRNRSERCRM